MEKSKGQANVILSLWGYFYKKSLAEHFREFAYALLIVSPLFIFLLYVFFPQTPNDWTRAFYPALKNPFSPYQFPLYNYPPWLTLIFTPFRFFSLRFSQSLNAFFAFFFISLLVVRSKGSFFSLLVTLTSFPFVALLGNASVDWVVAAGFVFPSISTVPLVSVKPQSGIFVILIWFKQASNKKRFVLLTFLFILATFLIWTYWPLKMWENIQALSLEHVNTSLFPWSIPLALLLLYFAWVNEDDLLAAGASLSMAPYFSPQSLIVSFAILSGRYPKIAALLSAFLWWFYYFR
jgi:hypothetical protein